MDNLIPLLRPDDRASRVEASANACLQECAKVLNLPRIPVPIPVDHWIETALKIRFGITDLSHLGPDVLGGASPSENEIVISESVLSHEPRFRFTCAHELGHMMLHKDKGRAFYDSTERPQQEMDRIEREADRFAAAFLMPATLLTHELVRLCDERNLKTAPTIAELMLDTPESDWLWKKIFLPSITRRFGLSRQATIYRFRELRRFDGRSFLFDRQIDRLLQPVQVEVTPRLRKLMEKSPAEATLFD